jgi:hypothetical protein
VAVWPALKRSSRFWAGETKYSERIEDLERLIDFNLARRVPGSRASPHATRSARPPC